MKTIVLLAITFYKEYLAIILKQIIGTQNVCKFSPTCSEYTKQAVQTYGVMKGLGMGMKQILHCHPYSRVISYKL